MVRVFLIRVGMDSVYGGFVSPIFPDESYVFLPIPNAGREGDTSSKGLRPYAELKTNSNLPLTDFLPKDKIEVEKRAFVKPQKLPVHNDPEFVTMTYGGNKGKNPKSKHIYDSVKNFSEGDYIAFYAAFFLVPNADFKYRFYDLSDLQKQQKNNLQYSIFAFLKLKYPPIDRSNYHSYENEICNNAHYLRGDFESKDSSYILKGENNSGWTGPIRMDDGRKREHNGPNYQMKDDFAKFKLENKLNKGLNRCYCYLEDRIVPLLLENKL